MSDPLTYTPPELAKRWRVQPAKILGWIRNGTLRAVEVPAHPGGRPRFRVPADAVVEFEQKRSVRPPVKPARRRRQPAEIIRFFWRL